MRVAQLYRLRNFRILDENPTDPSPGEVQVRVRSIGICGSDLHYFSDGAIGDTVIDYPVILGHEPTGEVAKLGAGVSGISIGDKAMLEPAVYCYHCEFCRTGHHNCCSNMSFLSSPPAPGFFREFVNLPAHNLVPLPPELDFQVGTLFEPLAVVLHSLQFASMQIGETACVFGGGPIGLLTLLALKTAGAGRVWLVEPRKERRELAQALGADVVIDPHAEDPVGQINAETGKRGVDASFDCAAKENTVGQMFDVTRSTGRAIMTGIPSESNTPINFHVLRRKEITLFNVRRANHETEAAVAMLRAAPARFAPIITHRKPIESVENAFTMMESGEGGASKIILNF
jgi:L-iditol 2-dehydrogenase